MLGSDIVLTIVGNKIDLKNDINVPLETAESYAQSVGATHFETSAKNNIGVEELFLELTELVNICLLKFYSTQDTELYFIYSFIFR